MARPAARRAMRSRARGLLLLATAAVAVAVAVAAAAEEAAAGSGGTFEFNLPGHGNVKASWRVAEDEESRWLDRMAAESESSSSSGSAARGGGDHRHRIPFGDDSVKFSSDAYEFIADLLRQGTDDDGKGERPTGYWEKVDEEGSRMLDRIAAANARHRAEANGDDDIGGFGHSVFSGKSKQHGEEPSHVESDEFSNSKFPPHDDM